VRPRVSHVAVLAGTRLLVHGGWNGRELNDLLALDLVPEPEPESGAPSPAGAAGAGAAQRRQGYAGEQSGEASSADEEDGASPRGGGVACAQA
jgi:hypothetical protein